MICTVPSWHTEVRCILPYQQLKCFGHKLEKSLFVVCAQYDDPRWGEPQIFANAAHIPSVIWVPHLAVHKIQCIALGLLYILQHSDFIDSLLLYEHFARNGNACHAALLVDFQWHIWLSTMWSEEFNFWCWSYMFLYCLNIPDSFLHVKIVPLLAWELKMQTNSWTVKSSFCLSKHQFWECSYSPATALGTEYENPLLKWNRSANYVKRVAINIGEKNSLSPKCVL